MCQTIGFILKTVKRRTRRQELFRAGLKLALGIVFENAPSNLYWAMKKLLNNPLVAVVCKITTALVVIGVIFKAALYAISVFWPLYDYDLNLSSPNARYDLVVLRGDASAIDDFSYNIYVFPHALTPQKTPQGKQVLMTGIWRDKTYLVYSGYSVPMFRWTGTNSIEIDLDDLYENVFEFHPVTGKDYDSEILASLIFGKTDARNIMP